jgi:hypothetical protein
MLITINILSAMSIVMALFIPYLILLHINNKLRKEVEGALNRVLELKVYSEENREQLIDFAKSSNHNFEGQDKNWENYRKTMKLAQETISLFNQELKDFDKKLNIHIENTKDAFRLHNQLHDKTITFMNVVEKRINQKQTLKEILETPIEVKKTACETKLKLKEEVNANDIKTVTEIVNKVDFNHGKSNFKIGDVFRKTEDTVFISRDGEYIKILNLNSGFGKNIFNKFLQLNEN